MIRFQNWKIHHDGSLFARQYDNLSRRLEVIGDLPKGWEWDMLVQVENAMDIISLTLMDGGIGVTLTQSQLSAAGYYSVQLRGRQGDVVRHTNVLQLFVPKSLSGTDQWPEIPSKFQNVERRIAELNSHPPVPGKDGYWMIWNPETKVYENSNFSLPPDASVSYESQSLTADQQFQARINIGAEPLEVWKPIADITLEETVNSIQHIFADSPMKKIRVLIETPAHTSNTNYAPVGIFTSDDGSVVGAARIHFYLGTAIPTTAAASTLIEAEVVKVLGGRPMAKVTTSYSPTQYTRTEENSSGGTKPIYALGTGKIQSSMWQPWDIYGQTIRDHITGFNIQTYSEFAVGTHLRIWGVPK